MHDAQIRVAIAGAGGRMGRQLLQAVQQMDGAALGAAQQVAGLWGERYTSIQLRLCHAHKAIKTNVAGMCHT